MKVTLSNKTTVSNLNSLVSHSDPAYFTQNTVLLPHTRATEVAHSRGEVSSSLCLLRGVEQEREEEDVKGAPSI